MDQRTYRMFSLHGSTVVPLGQGDQADLFDQVMDLSKASENRLVADRVSIGHDRHPVARFTWLDDPDNPIYMILSNYTMQHVQQYVMEKLPT